MLNFFHGQREGYGFHQLLLAMVGEVLGYPGSWYCNWKTGLEQNLTGIKEKHFFVFLWTDMAVGIHYRY